MNEEQFVSLAEKKFKENHWRYTSGARNVAKVLGSTITPVSVQDIRSTISEKGLSIDIATIYRLLERFTEQKLIHRVQDGFMPCSDPENESESHHFLVCENCGKAEEIFLNYHDAIAKQLEKEKEFELETVEMTFMGICRDCRPDNPAPAPKKRLFSF